jgi:hypothetical protein
MRQRQEAEEVLPRMNIADEIERYLRTGDADPHHAAWPGAFMERAQLADRDLRAALVREVKRLAGRRTQQALPATDMVALTRNRVEPMVRGLFARVEQDVVLALLEKSVVFVTRSNIEAILRECTYGHTAWDLANLYLTSVGAPLLGPDAISLVGLSEATTCYVSPDYFAEDDPFADFIVHEAAHIFHNCKRGTAGLRQTRRKEWLLDIDFRRRETFAYSCEAYARILARAKTAAVRRALAQEYGSAVRISESRVDAREVASIILAAAGVRNGWKLILARCSPTSRPVSSLAHARANWAAEAAARAAATPATREDP